MSSRQAVSHSAIAIGLAFVLAACGGSSGPTAPSPAGSSSSSSGATSGATVTISASGQVSPASVTIAVGQAVTFVNNDSRSHQISSDPHPVHTDCPPINAVGTLGPGQTRLTGAFAAAATCGFHDHNDPTNANLQGRIIVR